MILAGRCKSCDFENSFKYGGNRFDHQTNCQVPGINIETDEFENVNYFEFENIPKYKFYSNNQLKGDNEGNITMDNFDLKLNAVNNYCPKCKNFTLDFRITIYY